MTPRLLPAAPAFVTPSEALLWKKLRGQLPDDSFLAANVHLQSHQDFYEADLVVGLPGASERMREVLVGDGSEPSTGGRPGRSS